VEGALAAWIDLSAWMMLPWSGTRSAWIPGPTPRPSQNLWLGSTRAVRTRHSVRVPCDAEGPCAPSGDAPVGISGKPSNGLFRPAGRSSLPCEDSIRRCVRSPGSLHSRRHHRYIKGFLLVSRGLFRWAVEPATSPSVLICASRQIAPFGSLRFHTVFFGDPPRSTGWNPVPASGPRSGPTTSPVVGTSPRQCPHLTFRDNR